MLSAALCKRSVVLCGGHFLRGLVLQYLASFAPPRAPAGTRGKSRLHPQLLRLVSLQTRTPFGLLQYQQEIPYSCAVDVVDYKERPGAKDFIDVSNCPASQPLSRASFALHRPARNLALALQWVLALRPGALVRRMQFAVPRASDQEGSPNFPPPDPATTTPRRPVSCGPLAPNHGRRTSLWSTSGSVASCWERAAAP